MILIFKKTCEIFLLVKNGLSKRLQIYSKQFYWLKIDRIQMNFGQFAQATN